MIEDGGNLVDIEGHGLEFVADAGLEFVALVHDDLSLRSMCELIKGIEFLFDFMEEFEVVPDIFELGLGFNVVGVGVDVFEH